jgi:hypothetical protein
METYYEAMVISTVWYWHEEVQNEGDRVEPRNRCTPIGSSDF